MARKKRSASTVTLPWERRGAVVRDVLAGSRWKTAVVGLALVFSATAIYRDAERRGRVHETRMAIVEVQRAIADFRTEVGRCPSSTSELLHPPFSRARYLREMPKDGWGRSLWVRCPGHIDPDAADVVSSGPSGDFFVDDNLQ